jgi:AcrR family transcriptional regulator
MAAAAVRSPRRRPTEEVRARILEAARQLFVAEGYRATTTKEIALKAGVVEKLIFSNFGSKAKLFEATLLTPFVSLFSDYVDSWSRPLQGSEDAEQLVERFVTGLFDLFHSNRELLRPLIAAQIHDGDDLQGLAQTISAQVAGALSDIGQPVVLDEATRFFDFEDFPVIEAAAIGMILSMVLLDDWLFPPGRRRPSRARQIRAVCDLMFHGVSLWKRDAGP